MSLNYEGLRIEGVYTRNPYSDPRFVAAIEWSAPNIGFGTIDLFRDNEGNMCADTEHMGKGFLYELIKTVKVVG